MGSRDCQIGLLGPKYVKRDPVRLDTKRKALPFARTDVMPMV